ncbi:HK97 family phage prohead protease [Brevundimonas naejangsanensis]|uniref:HK97 family phage prohead protease n=1 Tax=Brevundimonas naejangsanensis TaxID=588932 RepID=UPI0023E17C47|nr:HK97 family phage prohead protease [Brevundimonas naejangsanensis]
MRDPSPDRARTTAAPPCAVSLSRKGRGEVVIHGYASLWGVADLNGDVVARGAFAESLARTGAGGVRMLHQHESRAVVGVWDEMVEDERGLWVEGRIEDWSAEARYAAALTRAGALDGLSIGFRAAKARRERRLRVLSAVELWEVSLVTFPMLPGARFRSVASGRAAAEP